MALGIAMGILMALSMVALGLAAMYCQYGGAMVTLLSDVYIGYAATHTGLMWGALWGLIDGFIGGLLLALFYNCALKCCCKKCKTEMNPERI